MSAKRTETTPYRGFDCDKGLRAVFDSCTDAGLWADDARVAEVIRLAKVWSGYDPAALDVPGVLIAAAEMQEGWRRVLTLRARMALVAHRTARASTA